MQLYKKIILYLYIVCSLCFGTKQIIYGKYALLNIDIPNNSLSPDTILWKYYNQDEKIISEGELTTSPHIPGLNIHGPGTFSFYFDTEDYYGALDFTIKKTVNNIPFSCDVTYMDGKNQWVQENKKNKNSPNSIMDIEIEFDYSECKKKTYGFLEVITDPKNANIYIDNEYIGKSPLSGYNLKYGEYELKIDGADDDNCIQYEPKYQTINIAKSEYLFINDTLSLIPADINLSSIPPESRMFINKVDYGNITKKGIDISIPPGKNRFIFLLGKHYFSKKQLICSGSDKWTFNLIDKNAQNLTVEKVENAWLTLSGSPSSSKIKIKNESYNSALSYLPIMTNTKSVVIESNGFINEIIDLSEYNLQPNKHLELKYKLEAIDYVKALRLSRFYFEGKFFSGFTGLGHMERNERAKGLSWMGLQFIGFGAAIHSFSQIYTYERRMQYTCAIYANTSPSFLEGARQNCIDAVKKKQIAVTYSIGINMFNAYIHFLSIWDFNR